MAGLLCSLLAYPFVKSKVLLCPRKGTSYSTYSSQNLLHLHNNKKRSHWYEPASCYSPSVPGLLLLHHQGYAEPRRLQGLLRTSRTVSIKLRHQVGWSVLKSRPTGSLTERIFWYLNGSLDFFRQNPTLKCVLCEYLGQNLMVGLIATVQWPYYGTWLPAFVVVQICPSYFAVWVGPKHTLSLVISAEKC